MKHLLILGLFIVLAFTNAAAQDSLETKEVENNSFIDPLLNYGDGIDSINTLKYPFLKTTPIIVDVAIEDPCAHGHICCQIGCSCCPKGSRQGIKTIKTPKGKKKKGKKK